MTQKSMINILKKYLELLFGKLDYLKGVYAVMAGGAEKFQLKVEIEKLEKEIELTRQRIKEEASKYQLKDEIEEHRNEIKLGEPEEQEEPEIMETSDISGSGPKKRRRTTAAWLNTHIHIPIIPVILYGVIRTLHLFGTEPNLLIVDYWDELNCIFDMTKISFILAILCFSTCVELYNFEFLLGNDYDQRLSDDRIYFFLISLVALVLFVLYTVFSIIEETNGEFSFIRNTLWVFTFFLALHSYLRVRKVVSDYKLTAYTFG